MNATVLLNLHVHWKQPKQNNLNSEHLLHTFYHSHKLLIDVTSFWKSTLVPHSNGSQLAKSQEDLVVQLPSHINSAISWL